jgi:hypothetical protein
MAIRNEKQSEESGGLGDALSRSTKYGRAIIPMFYDDGIRFVGIMPHAVAVEEFIAEHPVTAHGEVRIRVQAHPPVVLQRSSSRSQVCHKCAVHFGPMCAKSFHSTPKQIASVRA